MTMLNILALLEHRTYYSCEEDSKWTSASKNPQSTLYSSKIS